MQAFPKGSPLVPDISRAVLSVMESESMMRITDKWFRNETDCSQLDGTFLASDSLPLDSFKGIFLIAGASASSALLIFFFRFLNQNKEILESDDSTWQKISALARVFYEGNEDSPKSTEKRSEGNESVVYPNETPDNSLAFPQTIIAQSPGVFTHDEGFVTTEPPSPVHDTISITESAAAER